MAPYSRYSEATYGLPSDPADISIYESDGLFDTVSRFLYTCSLLPFTATAQGKLINTAVTENSLFEQHITTTPLPRLRIM